MPGRIDQVFTVTGPLIDEGELVLGIKLLFGPAAVGGLAGDFAAREIGMRPMVASDIRRHLSAAIRSLDAGLPCCICPSSSLSTQLRAIRCAAYSA